ncbi:MAG: hypothetical protein AB1Z20_04710 [Desulfobacterales bacterium]
MVNLIRNAFQFTSRGTITITIDEAQINVRATGVGIETDQLDSVTQHHINDEEAIVSAWGCVPFCVYAIVSDRK